MNFYQLILCSLIFFSCTRGEIGYRGDYNEFLDINQSNSNLISKIKKAPCEDGFAGKYPCKGYDLIAHLSLTDFESERGNDSWGWIDSLTQKEYVLMGLDDGTAFVDISDPENPIFLGKLMSATSKSIWRDIKVYNDHAFIVSEAENHGLQIIDLKKLRNWETGKNLESDATLNTFGNAHNIAINEESGYAYVVGTSRSNDYNGGVHFIDISDPKNPNEVGGFGGEGYTHDAQVVNYIGPDSDYSGKEIFVGSNESKLVFVDVSNKENPTSISSIEYENVAYTHQGWFTEDQRFFILGDEADEIQRGGNTRTIIIDVIDLDDPKVHQFYYSPTPAIDHNGYVKGDKFFLANYTSGIRIIDISGISDKEISEIGFFDTYPTNNSTSFNGVWSVYPYFESGIISISDSDSGLFLVKKSD